MKRFRVIMRQVSLGTLVRIVEARSPAEAIEAVAREELPRLRDPVWSRVLLDGALGFSGEIGFRVEQLPLLS